MHSCDLGYHNSNTVDIHAPLSTGAPAPPIGTPGPVSAAAHPSAPQLRHGVSAQAQISQAISPNMAQTPQGVSSYHNVSSSLRNHHKETVIKVGVAQPVTADNPALASNYITGAENAAHNQQ